MRNTNGAFSKDGIPHIRVVITLPIRQGGPDMSTDWLLTRLLRGVTDRGGEMSGWPLDSESQPTT